MPSVEYADSVDACRESREAAKQTPTCGIPDADFVYAASGKLLAIRRECEREHRGRGRVLLGCCGMFAWRKDTFERRRAVGTIKLPASRDPLLHGSDVVRGECIIARRHPFVRVSRCQTAIQFGLVRLARHDHLCA